MRKVFYVGAAYPRENVVVMEFNRADLEAMHAVTSTTDRFSEDIYDGLMLLRQAEIEAYG